MINIAKRQDFLYFIVGLLILGRGFFSYDIIDIAFHDTYFIIKYSDITFVLSFLYFSFTVFEFVFFKIKRPLNKMMFRIHFGVTTIGLIILQFTYFINQQNGKVIKDYSVFDQANSVSESINGGFIILFIILLIVIVQFLFIVNILRSLFCKKNIL